MATASTGAAPVVPAPVVNLWPQAAASVQRARRSVRETLAFWGLAALADDAELVVAELVTNAVEHPRTPCGHVETRYTLLPRSAGIRIEVHDADSFSVPMMRPSADDDGGGRGLRIVDSLTQHMWGVKTREGAPGKLVWALLGAHTGDVAAYCNAYAPLGARLEDQALALDCEIISDLITRKLLCFLESGHPDDHSALVYDHLEGIDAGAVWTRWGSEGVPGAIAVLPDCPVHGSAEAGGCSLFAAHPGRHTWEWEA